MDDHTVDATTSNVTAFTLDFAPGGVPLDVTQKPTVRIDGQKVTAPSPLTDRSWRAHFRKNGAKWESAEALETGLHKRHGLQGPIDDAFMDSSIMVRPTGQPMAPGVARDHGMAQAVSRGSDREGRYRDHRRRYR